MISYINKKSNFFGSFMLIIMFVNYWGNEAYGMPGGPNQPESTGFTPIGNTEMVNKFNGRFSYNIPLMDIGGYPLNLVYDANVNNDMEASWVGLGWTLNPGSINRNKRGLPDDFKGDLIKRENSRFPAFKVGVSEGGHCQIYNAIGLKLDRGLFYNNMTGWGTEVGFGASITGFGLGLSWDRTSNSQDGVTTTKGFSASLGKSFNVEGMKLNAGLSYGYRQSFNTRQGQLYRSHGLNFHASLQNSIKRTIPIGQWTTTFTDPSHIPSIEVPFAIYSGSVEFKFGGDFFGGDVGVVRKGFFSLQKFENDQKALSHKSFGFLYSDIAANEINSLMDFNREKDIAYHPSVPNIAIPSQTYDLFVLNQHSGGGQFRAYKNAIGFMKDPEASTSQFDLNIGAEAHFGSIIEAGLTVNNITASTKFESGIKQNDIYNNINYKNKVLGNPSQEHFYFKMTNELEENDPIFNSKLGGDKPVSLSLTSVKEIHNSFRGEGFIDNYSSPISKGYNFENTIKQRHNLRNKLITTKDYNKKRLNNIDDKIFSFDKINGNFSTNDFSYLNKTESNSINLNNSLDHQIAEFNILNEDGSQYNYGLPVYNIIQEDVTFSANENNSKDNNELVEYNNTDDSKDNNNGRDGYYNKEITPAYAHSWLLTSIVSPDYIDLYNDGITEDDNGTAVKFNYTNLGKYSWRTPTSPDYKMKALMNEGVEYLSDDNKGVYSYGEREEWYSHSIESKTHIAFFILEDRNDANPFNKDGSINTFLNKKQRLSKIVLYSKSDIKSVLFDPNAKMKDVLLYATPLKTIKFNYSYKLCKKTPSNNSIDGKLTLDSIQIYQGKNTSSYLAYKFDYSSVNPDYNSNNIDRWGNFKDESDNNSISTGLKNNKYPYSVQNSNIANSNASAWLLNKITLPSGGIIKVDYESHNYSYVQNKRAAKMYKIIGLGSNTDLTNSSNNLYLSKNNFNNYLFIETDQISGVTSTNVKDLFFEDKNNAEMKQYLYYKANVRLDNSTYENIPGYAEIDDIGITNSLSNGKQVIWVKIKDLKGFNPITLNSWQYIRDNIPELAYKGFPKRKFDFLAIAFSLLKNYANIVTSESDFETQASDRGLAKVININGTSMVRALIPDYTKFGGGARVKKITISDEWNELVNPKNSSGFRNPNIKTPEKGEYTVDYEYNKQMGKNNQGSPIFISSGVATYEPLLGGDENPWKSPKFYDGQINPEGPASSFNMEFPFGESMFPGADIGYSKVKITNNKTKINDLRTGDGFKIYEYFTSKEYPILVQNTMLNPETLKREKEDGGGFKFSWKSLIGLSTPETWDRMAASQGYSIILNDMNGKIKSEKYYKYGQTELSPNPFSEIKYSYRSTNNLPCLDEKGQIANVNLSENMDFTLDKRTVFTNVKINGLEPGGGIIPIPAIPPILPWGFVPSTFGSDEKYVNLVSTSKVVCKNFVVDKVEVNKDGAKFITENLIWDKKTNDVILSKTNNEFQQAVYSYNVPAYWAYTKFGHAFKNLGIELILSSATNANGLLNSTGIITGNAINYISHGDEVNLSFLMSGNIENKKMHVFSESGQLFLINYRGDKFIPPSGVNDFKLSIIRSTYKNQLNEPLMSISSKSNPINQTSISDVLDAKAMEYKDNWPFISTVNLPRLYNSTNCLNTIWTNPFKVGNSENWKLFRSYDLIGNRQGQTNTNETPKLNADGVSSYNNKMTKLFYISNGNNFVKNTGLDNWNTQSENTLFDNKGNLLESLTKYSSFGFCDKSQNISTPTPSMNNSQINSEELNQKKILELLFGSENHIEQH